MTAQLLKRLMLTFALLAPVCAMAQSPPPPSPASGTQLLKPEELDQLVAPIALYPDPLLAEVLMASTYPLDVVQAERWLQRNKKLKGDELKAGVDKQDWDDSIKSLIATPDVLAMMSDKIDWTEKLGDAVSAQQPDVMDAVQRLRARAQSNNKLTSSKEQTVSVKQVQNKQVIAIEPTDPGTVYVPYYDPGVVYGGWPYPAYPPYYWPAPGYIAAGVIATGLAFGAGYALGRWASGGNYWGGSVNWNNNNININRPGTGGGGNNWKPRVDHRQGAGNRGGRQQGLDFRGNRGQQVLNPGGNRGGNRPSAGGGNSGQAQEHVRQGLAAVTTRPRVQVAERRTVALITRAVLSSAEAAPTAQPRSIAGAEALLTPELAAACEPAAAAVTELPVAVAAIEVEADAAVAADGVPTSA